MYLNNIYLRNNGRMYKIDTGNSSKDIPQSQKKRNEKRNPNSIGLTLFILLPAIQKHKYGSLVPFVHSAN